MTLKALLTEDMKTAMRNGDKPRLGVIRLVNAAIKQREVDERIELDETQVLGVLEKMLKQRRDSVTQYENAEREDLAEVERFEIGVIESYLPPPLDEQDLMAMIDVAITETDASSVRDMGKVMAVLKERAAGRADMSVVSRQVKQRLA
ncbi:GatB/YqeY domain-containing protein [Oleiagrimonas sp.]|jgi:uncharacterized protein YqeY|uniref:GatB/YqeY domain-containing protein n=1 Tax=Oleiagrimonas sp. TaxID=2010330 RepID=UPI0026193673|nr:GatB/YqeY domain-containing protein [Oleiagrimonas sp.]MDA3914269.1 GatB/YqeY domain-containing protein [Oleiagrimonas sp.]